MSAQAADQLPSYQNLAWILTNCDVDAIVLKDGRDFRIRKVTSVNLTKKEVRFIPRGRGVKIVPLMEIADIVIA